MLADRYYSLPKTITIDYSKISSKDKLYSLTEAKKDETTTALHVAIEENDVAKTKEILNGLAVGCINSTDSKANTPLIKAVKVRYRPNIDKAKNLEIIHLLLQNKADPNIAFAKQPFENDRPDGFDFSPLICGLEKSDLDLTTLLLRYGAQKQQAFNPEENILKKQKLRRKENETYKLAKQHILTHLSNIDGEHQPKIKSTNQDKIDEAKAKIKANEEFKDYFSDAKRKNSRLQVGL